MKKGTGDFPGSILKLGDFFVWRGLSPEETKAVLKELPKPEFFPKGARIFFRRPFPAGARYDSVWRSTGLPRRRRPQDSDESAGRWANLWRGRLIW